MKGPHGFLVGEETSEFTVPPRLEEKEWKFSRGKCMWRSKRGLVDGRAIHPNRTEVQGREQKQQQG